MIFHYSGLEHFEWPQDFNTTTANGTVVANNIWPVLAINGVVGTVISEVLWLTYVCGALSLAASHFSYFLL